MSATLQGLAPTKAGEPADRLDGFLSEDRGVLRFMETKTDPTARGRNLLEVVSAWSDRRKEPPKFPVNDAEDAALAYQLIVDYFKKYNYNQTLFFEESKVSLSLFYGNFSRKTEDLRRDLGLLESELPLMPDTTTIDLNAEAARLGLSPAAALQSLQKTAAQETTKRAAETTKRAAETTKRAAASRRLRWGTDNRADENPAAFAWRAYQAEAQAGTLHMKMIRQEDRRNGTTLAVDLVSWLRSKKNKAQVPEGFDIPTIEQWNTRQIEAGKAQCASAPRTERERLYAALRRRRHRAQISL